MLRVQSSRSLSVDEREMSRQLVRAVGLEVAGWRKRTRGEAAHRRLVDFPAITEWLEPEDVAVDVSQEPHADNVSIITAWTEVVLCFDIMREQVVMSRRDSGVEVTDVTRPAVGVFHITLQACYRIIKHTGNVRW